MAYADITFNDKNRIKRWLQKERLITALKTVENTEEMSVVCDFGAGNGELCKSLSFRFPNAKVICYEPDPSLMEEAKENLKDLNKVLFVSDVKALESGTVDLIFSLEVFEHLPPKETSDALQMINSLLAEKGKLVIGVPVETGMPALYKGMFRIFRRYGSFDATFKNVFLSLIGRPPKKRPTAEIVPGFSYYHEHLGFNWRNLLKTLQSKFENPSITFSPCSLPLLNWFMPEVYFVIKKL